MIWGRVKQDARGTSRHKPLRWSRVRDAANSAERQGAIERRGTIVPLFIHSGALVDGSSDTYI